MGMKQGVSTGKRGFTLIELLIVIAVLGILAVAVLSAINPIEQINRSRDTGSRSDAEQLISAIDRFYASSGYYPWVVDAEVLDVRLDFVEVTADDWTDGTTPVLEKLSQAGAEELKTSFTNRITASGYNSLYIYNNGEPGDSTYVCFRAKSGSFQVETGKRCTAEEGVPDDFPALACPADCATTKTCYSCLP